jgi:hypothetical protein
MASARLGWRGDCILRRDRRGGLAAAGTIAGARMRLRANKPRSEPNDEFVWSEITCESQEAAQSEAERQQERDSADAEWIYLRNPSGQWVARRTPRSLKPPREPWWSSVIDAVLRV